MAVSTSEPYATVIVPTHDRASTLALAIGAIQAQTVPNIEIVISGDGVTEACRAIAERFASDDSRVVFNDFPKAPKAGGENRDRSVHLANSARIFYSDDDDLLLPHHVETLGPILDRYDAVDSAPAFVSRSGRVQIFLVNHGRGPLREALAEGQGSGKVLLDTHFAHRKAAYQRIGNPWALNTSSSATIGFFQKFAAERSICWKTIPIVTALSFNGRVRENVSPSNRQAELERWHRIVTGGGRLLDDAFYDWYFFSLARSIGASWPKALEAFMSPLCISVNGVRSDADVSYQIPEARLAGLHDLFALMGGKAVKGSDLGSLAARLADPLFGWARPNGAVGAALERALGTQRTLEVLREIDATDAYAREMGAFLECRLFLNNKESGSALKAMEALIEAGPYYPGEAHVQAALACRQMGNSERALEYARQAIRSDPTLKTGYQLAIEILTERGEFPEARKTAEEALAFLPDHIAMALVHHARAAERSSDRNGILRFIWKLF